MNVRRNPVLIVILAGLALTALGLTAATIDTTYSSAIPSSDSSSSGDGDGGFGDGEELDRQNNSQISADREDSDNTLQIPTTCLPILTRPFVILGLLIGMVGLIGVTYRQFGFIGASFSLYLVGMPLLIGYSLATDCSSAGGGTESPLAQLADASGIGGSPVATPLPPELLGAVFVAVTLAAGAALVYATGSTEIETSTEDDDEGDLSDVAAVAGAAADRLESGDADVDNAVYRAWWEMTELLDISDPDSSTAGEFADAAIETGMDQDDVSEITRLFEEVRYGGMDPEPREELALDTLRHVERTYGPSGDDDGGEGE